MNVDELPKARRVVRKNGPSVSHIWYARACGVELSYISHDLDAEFWYTPVETMSQRGVALIDANGKLVKAERRNR